MQWNKFSGIGTKKKQKYSPKRSNSKHKESDNETVDIILGENKKANEAYDNSGRQNDCENRTSTSKCVDQSALKKNYFGGSNYVNMWTVFILIMYEI